ncbi:MAG: prolipoprotein diacylglyceryl transferase [Bacteroidia bacterium]|nr:prolipoprotein diacylglyceryl transferase [Bacteroidia bacterium]
MLLDYIVWTVKPEAFSIGGHEIRWYGLLLACGFYMGFFVLQKILKKENFKEDRISLLAIFVFAGTIIGLRLGHCLFYEPGYYLSHPLDILKVWEGGLASHGAAVGILIAVFIYCKKYHVSYISLLDKVVIIIPLSGGMVRIGNLMNSEIFGKPTALAWGFIFTNAGQTEPRHPTQIYEALIYFAIFIILMWLYYRKNAGTRTGYLLGVFLILLFFSRFLIEFVKDVQVDFEKNLPLDMGQILSIPFIALGIFLLYRAFKKPFKIS